MSDPLDGLFRRLVANLTALDPAAVHRPVRIAEICERLVPYRTHRKMLGFDTNEDYELTILRLVAGERDLAQVFPAEVATALTLEAASVHPDTTILRRYPEATVLLNADQLDDAAPDAPRAPSADELALPGRAEPESPTPDAVLMEEEALEADAEDDADRMPFALEESDDARATARPREITVSAPCPYCGGGLPVGRTVLFCPHCGQNIGVVHCPTCGSELDVGWGFCITCGQKVSGLG